MGAWGYCLGLQVFYYITEAKVMIYNWEPQATENEDGEKVASPFSGIVKIEVPRYPQRLKYIKECNFAMDEKGQVKSGMDSIDSIIKMLEIASKHVQEVNLKHKDGAEFCTWDELQDNPMADGILNEVASAVINGPILGKS